MKARPAAWQRGERGSEQQLEQANDHDQADDEDDTDGATEKFQHGVLLFIQFTQL
ncbi:hypothetical protein ACSVIJ_03265 [Pseudomonas sp. NCHU5208]|nr:hypothetical protein [Pseudomonas sp. GOM7]WAJ39782.1 hypothetical protein OU800_11340 [Pseudomonas sp. GOM7]